MKRLAVIRLLLLCVLSFGVGFTLRAGDFGVAGANFSDNTERMCQDSLVVVFWNVENFFDHRSPHRPQYWTKRRFYAKCAAVSKVLFLVSERFGGRMPDVVGLAEVENEFVLKSLLSSTLLRKEGYKTLHFDSPDHRGIDCALLYRPSSVRLSEGFPVHVRSSDGEVLPTRDILVSVFDSLAVTVNHHPSRIGGKDEMRRRAFAAMTRTADSLLNESGGQIKRVLSMGDFNEDLWKAAPKGIGTIKYNGKWEQIDGYFAYGEPFKVKMEIFSPKELLTEDRSFGGLRPLRTFLGPRYAGGVSDHLPIVLVLYF